MSEPFFKLQALGKCKFFSARKFLSARVLNDLYPDHDRRSVCPDLGSTVC